ncbi:MAG: hypothetical protein F2813_02010 [Actinobacteria bacterium]|nr:hypothetical protein [Actinomycetota bacterium]
MTSSKRLLLLTLSLLVLVPANAHAFMTWNAPGNAEHERITRLAVACNSALDRPAPEGLNWRQDLCLPSGGDSVKQPWWFAFERSMRMLAGADSYFGGVGAPDRLGEVISSSDRAHCDNADAWFPTSQGPFGSYPRTFDQRAAGLRDCLRLLQKDVGVAVTQAGLLVDSNGRLDAPQADLSEDCNVDYDPDRSPNKTHDRGWAKCNALIALGRALHITEDFFSHSNWTDLNPGALNIKNPQGLQSDVRTVPSALGYPRTDADIDAFIAQTQVITGAYGSGTKNRVTHNDYLNKDEGNGTIGWTRGQIPTGDKGHSGRSVAGFDGTYDNFQRAAKGAAYAAASVWTDYRSRIFDLYGADRGAKIWNAVRENTPWTQCGQYGTARRALSPPNGAQSAARTIRVRVVNRSSSPLPCNDARLDSGEWSSLPADSLGSGVTNEFLVLSNGGGVDGMVAIGDVVFSFSNPLVGSNSYSCAPSGAVSCSTSGGKGNDATITLTITNRSARSSQALRRVKFAVPGRAARTGGVGAIPARSRDYRPSPPTTAKLNREISAKNKRELRSEVRQSQVCSGEGAAVQLRVDDVSCSKVLRQMVRTSWTDLKRYCPVGWRVLHHPRGIGAPEGATLCHVDNDVDNPKPDLRARAFFYVLPHSHG